MRSLLPALLAAAAVQILAGPAAAQRTELPITSPQEVFTAYQAVCLANPGDLDKQIATAKVAPFGYVLQETSADGSMRFENGQTFVAMRRNAKYHFCMAGGRTDPTVTRASIEAVSLPVLDKLGIRTTDQRGNTVWFDPAKPDLTLMYRQIDLGPIRMIARFSGMTAEQK
ncbi:MAG: hypothetical protein ACK4YM_07585 [Novosphingobium sp.]